jgi:toxin HigB-1
VIKSFKHKGLETFFTTGSKKGIQPAHASKLNNILTLLHVATKPNQMDVEGWFLHLLNPKEDNIWSVRVNANWRVTFRFSGEDAEIVDYLDYH